MNKFWIVLTHTYISRIKSKAFIISTIITLLFIVGITNIESIIKIFSSGDEGKEVIVIDETEKLFPLLEDAFSQPADDISVTLYKDNATKAKEAVREGTYDALLVLRLDEDDLPAASYFEKSASSSFIEIAIEQQLNQIKTAIATEQLGIDEATMQKMFADVPFEKVALDETSKTDEELNQTRGIVYIMLFVLYLAVIIYGQMIAVDVATEKSSRVMELLISSAPPVIHMFAKIIGIALLGITQLILFFVVGLSLLQTRTGEITVEVTKVFGLQDVSISIYIYAIIFFILGYLLYATIAAMLGSLVSRVEDVQHLLMPMVILIMLAFFISIFGLGNPEAKFITITSYIPFFTPMIMFLRVGMLDVALWELLISIGLLIATIIVVALLGARIYRGGVLMYGPSRTLKDFRQALTLSKREK